MGITNLLVNLSSIKSNEHISKYRGQTAAVDGSCWLHQGASLCAEDIVMGRSPKALLRYCKGKLLTLIKSGVTPIIIFDGQHLIMKKGVNEKRRILREKAYEEALELKKEGKMFDAKKKFMQAVHIKIEVRDAFISVLTKMKVEYYIAPYEADSQLAFMF